MQSMAEPRETTRPGAKPRGDRPPAADRDVVDGYLIGALIGEGGMARVYDAVRISDGREVALKVMRRRVARDPSAVERFRREAIGVQRIEHRHVVGVYEHGALRDGRRYAIMERLHGESLRARLDRGPMRVEEIMTIVEAVGSALEATHAHRVLHRDLKPENLFLVGGDHPTVKLLDFGIAQFDRALDLPPGRLTDAGFVIGTPKYIAPEQAQGLELSPATDVYALGVVLFEMLTGRLPFEGKSAGELLTQHFLAPAPRVSRLTAVPAALDDLVARMLAKTPSFRPSLDEVRRVAAIAARGRARARRHRTIAITVATGIAAAFAAGWWAGAWFT